MVIYNRFHTSKKFSFIINETDSISLQEKKALIDNELSIYLLKQLIIALNKSNLTFEEVISNNDFSPNNMIKILASLVPKNQHISVVGSHIHSILDLASKMQGSYIPWHDSDLCLPNEAKIQTKDNTWLSLKTNLDPDFVEIFANVYSAFMNDFLEKEISIDSKKTI